MASLLKRLPWLRRTWEPLVFPCSKAARLLPSDVKIEEELLPDYHALRYYPMQIGDILKDQYQVVGKLGWGASSTVWLARDLAKRRHVTLKAFVKSDSLGAELEHEQSIYNHISNCRSRHPGRTNIRQLIESFDIAGPDGQHRCLVHPPLFESVLTLLRSNPVERFPAVIVRGVLQDLFLALDYLHTECQIVHTDIKADNIIFGLHDDTVFQEFEEQERHKPSPRKHVDGRFVYQSRELRRPKRLGAPVLCDFGSAVIGNVKHSTDVQPNIYRSPEVILQVPWSYEIDIWNVGCMVFDIFAGGSLFSGIDPEHKTYRSRAHLAEMIALLGPPPRELLQAGKDSQRFFSDEGDFCAGIPAIPLRPLEQIFNSDIEDRAEFLAMMQKMLQWEPGKRATARELAEDRWLRL